MTATCPKCSRAYSGAPEQAQCIGSYGECLACHFERDAGTNAQLAELAILAALQLIAKAR